MVQKNLVLSADKIASEPLYILLAAQGHPDAHETVRKLVQESIEKKKSFRDLVKADSKLAKYFNKIPSSGWALVDDPIKYRGISEEKARKVARSWKARVTALSKEISK